MELHNKHSIKKGYHSSRFATGRRYNHFHRKTRGPGVMNSQAGFTLIEALITGVLSTIVAGGILSALYMTNTQIQDGSAALRLSQLQSVVSDQIHRSARLSAGAKDSTETGTLTLNALAKAGLDQILFCNS